MDILVDVKGCFAIEPHFFPYALGDLSGQVRFTRIGSKFGRSGPVTATHLELDLGTVDLRPAAAITPT